MNITKILFMLGLLALFGTEINAEGLGDITESVTSVKTDLLALMKILAAIGLLFIIGSYTLSTDENKRFPWKWVIGALAIGAFSSVITMFGLD